MKFNTSELKPEQTSIKLNLLETKQIFPYLMSMPNQFNYHSKLLYLQSLSQSNKKNKNYYTFAKSAESF